MTLRRHGHHARPYSVMAGTETEASPGISSEAAHSRLRPDEFDRRLMLDGRIVIVSANECLSGLAVDAIAELAKERDVLAFHHRVHELVGGVVDSLIDR